MAMSHRRPIARALGISALGLGLLAGAGRAAADPTPPGGGDFQILYSVTEHQDSINVPVRQMTTQDLQYFVNKARCECGQQIDAKIRINSAMQLSSVRVRTYVGSRCDQGQTQQGFGQAKPCLELIEEYTNLYTKSIHAKFDPIWLATGIKVGGTQFVGGSEPAANCSSGTGQGGISDLRGERQCAGMPDGRVRRHRHSEHQLHGRRDHDRDDGLGDGDGPELRLRSAEHLDHRPGEAEVLRR